MENKLIKKIKNLLTTNSNKTTDYKTLLFCKSALGINAVNQLDIKNIDIDYVLEQSYVFLTKEGVLTSKKKLESEIFKDKYNLYIEYCKKNKLTKKEYKRVEKLNTISVPDMSKIKIPNISNELNDMNIDLDDMINNFTKVFNTK
ncbi:MAG: hypothetical protein U9O56_05775 [Campylobacterota bacterium]|nr:hypothetical protein [Campylobacterota bacterium]